MTTREIRAMLRGATAAKVINGWNMSAFMNHNLFTIAPTIGSAAKYSEDDARTYAEMLKQAGVAPLYRDSEPDPL